MIDGKKLVFLNTSYQGTGQICCTAGLKYEQREVLAKDGGNRTRLYFEASKVWKKRTIYCSMVIQMSCHTVVLKGFRPLKSELSMHVNRTS